MMTEMMTEINQEDIIEAVEHMTDEDLNELVGKIQKVKLARERQKAREYKKKILDLAAEAGIKVRIEDEEHKEIKRKKVKPKYRHPENPEITWTGRGIKPVWIRELEERGRDINEFRIQE